MAIVPDPEMMDELVRRTTPGTGPKPLSYEELLARYRWLCSNFHRLSMVVRPPVDGVAVAHDFHLKEHEHAWGRFIVDPDSMDAAIAKAMQSE